MSLRLRSRAGALNQLRGPREWLLMLRVGAFAAAAPALLRLPLPRLAALLARPTVRRATEPDQIARLDRVVALAPTVAGPLVRTGCLTRGLTLFWFLRRSGVEVELRFGVDPDAEAPTDGHCWLTLDGEPFLEKRDPRARFTELYRLPPARV